MYFLFHSRIPLLLAALLLVGFPLSAQSQTSNLGINLVIPISTPDGKRELSLDRYPRFHVVLTNQTQNPVFLWKDWNSWGYFNLVIEAQFEDGKKMIRKARPAKWDGDFPDFWQLKGGESIVMEVDMSTGHWKGFPDLYGEALPATVKAVYDNKTDMLAEEYGIWVGRVESQEVSVVFR